MQRLGLGGTAIGIEPLSPADANALAQGVGKAYWENARLVANLGAQFGFRALFYWQPALFEKTQVTPYEQSELQTWQDYGKFFLSATRAVAEMRPATKGQPDFWNLEPLLADVATPLYLDFAHVSEEGNDRIAHKIAADVVASLGLSVARSRSP